MYCRRNRSDSSGKPPAIDAALTPCGGSYSADRVRALRKAERAGRAVPEERGPVWGLTLIAFQVSAVYFWGAFDKSKLQRLGYSVSQVREVEDGPCRHLIPSGPPGTRAITAADRTDYLKAAACMRSGTNVAVAIMPATATSASST